MPGRLLIIVSARTRRFGVSTDFLQLDHSGKADAYHSILDYFVQHPLKPIP